MCCAGLAVVAVMRHRILLWRLRDRRSGWSPEEFVRHFVRHSVSPEIAETCLALIHERIAGRRFPVLPSDEFEGVYWLCDEDLDDLVKDLCARCDRDPTTAAYSPPRTVEDLVLFVSRLAPTKNG